MQKRQQSADWHSCWRIWRLEKGWGNGSKWMCTLWGLTMYVKVSFQFWQNLVWMPAVSDRGGDIVRREVVGDDVVTRSRHPSPRIHSATRATTALNFCTAAAQLYPPRSTIGNYRMGPPVWWKRSLCRFCPFHRFTVNRSLISQFQDYHSGRSGESEIF